MDATLVRLLRDGAARFGVEVDDRITAALSTYLDRLLFWNQRVNLTALRDAPSIVDKHFVDSLAVVPHIPTTARSLVDLGSGAGFPGAVVAIVRSDLQVSLVESVHKKCAFLEALRREVPVPNLKVSASRAEDFFAGARELPDVVVSRATWDLSVWLEMGARWVAPGGVVLGMEADTLHDLPPDATRHSYPLASGTRAIIVRKPWGPTNV